MSLYQPRLQYVAWFLRVIELDGDRWACRFGGVEYDTHAEVSQAIDHITVLAADHQPAELLLHRLDGSVSNLGAV